MANASPAAANALQGRPLTAFEQFLVRRKQGLHSDPSLHAGVSPPRDAQALRGGNTQVTPTSNGAASLWASAPAALLQTARHSHRTAVLPSAAALSEPTALQNGASTPLPRSLIESVTSAPRPRPEAATPCSPAASTSAPLRSPSTHLHSHPPTTALKPLLVTPLATFRPNTSATCSQTGTKGKASAHLLPPGNPPAPATTTPSSTGGKSAVYSELASAAASLAQAAQKLAHGSVVDRAVAASYESLARAAADLASSAVHVRPLTSSTAATGAPHGSRGSLPGPGPIRHGGPSGAPSGRQLHLRHGGGQGAGANGALGQDDRQQQQQQQQRTPSPPLLQQQPGNAVTSGAMGGPAGSPATATVPAAAVEVAATGSSSNRRQLHTPLVLPAPRAALPDPLTPSNASASGLPKGPGGEPTANAHPPVRSAGGGGGGGVGLSVPRFPGYNPLIHLLRSDLPHPATPGPGHGPETQRPATSNPITHVLEDGPTFPASLVRHTSTSPCSSRHSRHSLNTHCHHHQHHHHHRHSLPSLPPTPLTPATGTAGPGNHRLLTHGRHTQLTSTAAGERYPYPRAASIRPGASLDLSALPVLSLWGEDGEGWGPAAARFSAGAAGGDVWGRQVLSLDGPALEQVQASDRGRDREQQPELRARYTTLMAVLQDRVRARGPGYLASRFRAADRDGRGSLGAKDFAAVLAGLSAELGLGGRAAAGTGAMDEQVAQLALSELLGAQGVATESSRVRYGDFVNAVRYGSLPWRGPSHSRPALSGVREDARAISPARGIAANVSGDHSQQATAQPQPHAQTQRATASQWARLEELRCAFRRADGDGDGVVRWPQFRAALGEVCGRHRVALSDQDAERVYWDAEPDTRGGVDYEAFIASYKLNGPYDNKYDSGYGDATAAAGAQISCPVGGGPDATPCTQQPEPLQHKQAHGTQAAVGPGAHPQQAPGGSSVAPWRGPSRQGRGPGGQRPAGRQMHMGSTHADAAAVLKQLGGASVGLSAVC